MKNNIVARLRSTGGLDARLLCEAADEIERLHRDYSCICSEMRRMMEERDAARRLYCRAVEEIEHGMTNETQKEVADFLGWDCFKENTND